jgi:hypothetical protein
MSFLYFFGITHELTIKVKIGIIKALMIRRLADTKFSNWKLIPLKYLKVFGKIWLIFRMNIDVKKHKQFLNNIPEFYKNVLTSWMKTGGGQLSFKTLTLYVFFVFFWNNT